MQFCRQIKLTFYGKHPYISEIQILNYYSYHEWKIKMHTKMFLFYMLNL